MSASAYDTWATGRTDGRFSEWLREGAEPAWSEAVNHRFTLELADGTLADEVMRRYLVQDYSFLDSFVRLTASAIVKAPSLADRVPLGHFLGAVTGEENTYFQRAFDALGVPAEGERRPGRTTAQAEPSPAEPFAIHAGVPLTVPETHQPRNIVAALQATVRRQSDQEALRWKDQGHWIGLTYAELWNRVRATSLALHQRGVRAGDHVVILARSRPEWVVADFATLALGAVVCPIYPGESDARIEQIARGGPVTVTHPEMQRYFMTIPEAASLVIEAGAMGDGGELLILDMGEPVRILDLAKKMIRLSALVPDEDIQIVFTGTRPGEKLFEELAVTGEGIAKTRHPKIFTGRLTGPPRGVHR